MPKVVKKIRILLEFSSLKEFEKSVSKNNNHAMFHIFSLIKANHWMMNLVDEEGIEKFNYM